MGTLGTVSSANSNNSGSPRLSGAGVPAKRRGPVPRHPLLRRTTQVTLRLSPREFEALYMLAAEAGARSVRQFIRRAALGAQPGANGEKPLP